MDFFKARSAVNIYGIQLAHFFLPITAEILLGEVQFHILRKFYGLHPGCFECSQPFEVPRVFCGTFLLKRSNKSSRGLLLLFS